MSTPPKVQRTTVPAIRARKGGQPLVCLTAYTTTMARLLDPLVDVLLVGDSLGMVVYGFDSTLPVTLEHTIAHTRAVVRGASHACVIADLPFGSYQESPEAAFRTSARVMAETGCAGIKLEGGAAMAPTVRFLVERGIPVMGHVGLLPQSFNLSGGFGTRGRTAAEARHIQADAKAVAEAGAFALVVEGVVEPLARRITEAVPIPTIGIGASVVCDGQILVAEDLLGLFREFKPKFVKRYAELGAEIERAVSTWAADVRERRFPGPEQVFAPRPEARAASARPRIAKSGKPH